MLPASFRSHRSHRYIHPCEICGRIFNSIGNLERHKIIHTGRSLFSYVLQRTIGGSVGVWPACPQNLCSPVLSGLWASPSSFLPSCSILSSSIVSFFSSFVSVFFEATHRPQSLFWFKKQKTKIVSLNFASDGEMIQVWRAIAVTSVTNPLPGRTCWRSTSGCTMISGTSCVQNVGKVGDIAFVG